MLLVLTLIACAHWIPGGASITAEEATWRRMSFILARVADIQPEEARQEDGLYYMTLEPIATLAGDFDPSVHPLIKAELWASRISAGVQPEPPKIGELVMTLIMRRGSDGRTAKWAVPNSYFSVTGDPIHLAAATNTFAAGTLPPNAHPIVPIAGVDDPKVARALQRLHRERYNSRIAEGLPAVAPPPLPACTPQLFRDNIASFALSIDVALPTIPEEQAKYPALLRFRGVTLYVPQGDHPEPAPLGRGSAATAAIKIDAAKRVLDQVEQLGFFVNHSPENPRREPPVVVLSLICTLPDHRIVQCWNVLQWDGELPGKLLRLSEAIDGDASAAVQELIAAIKQDQS